MLDSLDITSYYYISIIVLSMAGTMYLIPKIIKEKRIQKELTQKHSKTTEPDKDKSKVKLM